ncbi:MAG: carboxymuconolactone decarboxylase family protein [Alphaproteobacteria bacterium]|nr:carboxymuconolactone decarboxylase family protein [Alphaproteobacteria bacterium]
MSDHLAQGIEVRKRLFGEERTNQALSHPDPAHQDFQQFITSYCFGAVWGEDGTAWRDRSLMTMAIVAAQHRFVEFETHVKLAIKNGCEQALLLALVKHLAVYCGVPTGLECFRIVQRVLAEAGA